MAAGSYRLPSARSSFVQALTAPSAGTTAESIGTKNALPTCCAQADSSSPSATTSSSILSMLMTLPVAFWAISQSQNAGQKSKP